MTHPLKQQLGDEFPEPGMTRFADTIPVDRSASLDAPAERPVMRLQPIALGLALVGLGGALMFFLGALIDSVRGAL